MSEEDWLAYAAELGLTPAQTEQVSALMTNQDLWQQSDELVQMFATLEAYGIRDYVQLCPAHHPRAGVLHRDSL